MSELKKVVIALGSNLGDRLENLDCAIAKLGGFCKILARSEVYCTPPVGYLEQGDFFNMALLVETACEPFDLLHLCKQIEKDMGRAESFRNAPRPIDIDIIFYQQAHIDSDILNLPHPRWSERDFVKTPLLDLFDSGALDDDFFAQARDVLKMEKRVFSPILSINNNSMENNTGTLYVVATPIGNLSDISQRAVDTLKSVDIVACEDTRVTGRLLNKFDISKEMFVYEDSRERNVAPILLHRLKEGKNVALVTDAGTPCMSDPGFRIIRACRSEGIKVEPIPGACAFITALSASGLPSDSFLFAGFLPAKTAARKTFFEKYKDFEHTLIFYESPYRIDKFLDDALEVFGGERTVCFAKELTKMFERFFVRKLSSVAVEMKKSSLKGEFVIIIAPKDFQL